MGILKTDSFHSKHAGQTIDDAIDGWRGIAETINYISANIESLKHRVENLENALNNKYDKTGGDVKGKVRVTGGNNIANSIVQVKEVTGYKTGDGSKSSAELFLNKSSTGNVYMGQGGAYINAQGKVFGAVWNDVAEYRQSEETEAGRVICEHGDGTLHRSTKRLQAGAQIVSDTFGFAIGETHNCHTPVAIAGRVLAYTHEDWWCFEPGQPVCAGPNGTVSIMSRREARKYPDRIIGVVSELPTYEYWGDNKIPVNGRIWIKIK